MGAWGVGSFDNDTACDWAGDLQGARDLGAIRHALADVLAAGDDELDSDTACCALAACEVIARLKGNWGTRDAYTEDVDDWVARNPVKPPEDVVNGALTAIERIRTAPSELLELWQDADPGGWLSNVEDLRNRVED